jgi:hyperosmotically inducible periplasmic protein
MRQRNDEHSRRRFQLGPAVLLAGFVVMAGCNSSQPASPDTHADVVAAITNSFKDAALNNITITQDAEKHVITLKGHVPFPDEVKQAVSLAKQAAPDYTIADEVDVLPPNRPQS